MTDREQVGPLPCPFCGGETDVRRESTSLGLGLWRVCCDSEEMDCSASGPFAGTRELAIVAWNRRAAPPDAGDWNKRSDTDSAWVAGAMWLFDAMEEADATLALKVLPPADDVRGWAVLAADLDQRATVTNKLIAALDPAQKLPPGFLDQIVSATPPAAGAGEGTEAVPCSMCGNSLIEGWRCDYPDCFQKRVAGRIPVPARVDAERQAVMDAAVDFADARMEEVESGDALSSEALAIVLNDAVGALIRAARRPYADGRTMCAECAGDFVSSKTGYNGHSVGCSMAVYSIDRANLKPWPRAALAVPREQQPVAWMLTNQDGGRRIVIGRDPGTPMADEEAAPILLTDDRSFGLAVPRGEGEREHAEAEAWKVIPKNGVPWYTGQEEDATGYLNVTVADHPRHAPYTVIPLYRHPASAQPAGGEG